MTVHTITTTWKKVLERQARHVTLLFTFPFGVWTIVYVRLGEGAPGYQDADMLSRSSYFGRVISIPVPPNTPVYAKTYIGMAYISCTIIPSIEEE